MDLVLSLNATLNVLMSTIDENLQTIKILYSEVGDNIIEVKLLKM